MDQHRPLPGETLDVLVVGAGQAGLALGRYLQQQDARFLLVDAGARVGDVWRSRWDSLRLFTAAEHDGLPDLPFPGEPGTYPGKDAVADYLEGYAATFDLPVRLGTRVTRLRRTEEVLHGGDVDRAGAGPAGRRRHRALLRRPHPCRWRRGSTRRSSRCTARSTAARPTFPTGRSSWSAPGTPACRSPTSWLASGRPVALAVGTRPRTVPQRPLGRDLFWWLTRTGLLRASVDSRLGRRLRDRELVIGTSWRGLRERGVDLRPRLVGASGRTVTFARREHHRRRRGGLGDRLPPRPRLARRARRGRGRPRPRTPAGSVPCRGCSSSGCRGSTPAARRCSGSSARTPPGWPSGCSGPARSGVEPVAV